MGAAGRIALIRVCLGLLEVSPALSAPAADTVDSMAPVEEHEAMEVGGLLTVDGANRFSDWENTPAVLGQVELSAKVHVHDKMQGAITLLSEGDPSLIVIDQAVGQWSFPEGQIIFGQQYFNHGLLTTRLISDPLMLDRVEFAQAGITGLWIRESLALGLGLTSLATGSQEDPTHDPCLVANADFAPGGQLLRLSTLLSRQRKSMDGAANWAFGRFLFDAEAAWLWKDKEEQGGLAKGGYALGAAFTANHHVEMGFRWDGLGDEENALSRQRFGGGLTVTLVEHVFGAGEIAWDQEEDWVFAVQMGLRSELKLPGFQRKTLVK